MIYITKTVVSIYEVIFSPLFVIAFTDWHFFISTLTDTLQLVMIWSSSALTVWLLPFISLIDWFLVAPELQSKQSHTGIPGDWESCPCTLSVPVFIKQMNIDWTKDIASFKITLKNMIKLNAFLVKFKSPREGLGKVFFFFSKFEKT